MPNQMKQLITAILTLLSLSAFGQSAADYYNKGIEKSNSKNYREAIADYSEAIKIDPNFPDAGERQRRGPRRQ